MKITYIPTGLNGIGIIKTSLTKRYPKDEGGYCRNQISTLLVSVESGAVKLFLESAGFWNGTYYVAGQSFVIGSEQNYYLERVGDEEVLLGVVSAPVWERAQHIIESGK